MDQFQRQQLPEDDRLLGFGQAREIILDARLLAGRLRRLPGFLEPRTADIHPPGTRSRLGSIRLVLNIRHGAFSYAGGTRPLVDGLARAVRRGHAPRRVHLPPAPRTVAHPIGFPIPGRRLVDLAPERLLGYMARGDQGEATISIYRIEVQMATKVREILAGKIAAVRAESQHLEGISFMDEEAVQQGDTEGAVKTGVAGNVELIVTAPRVWAAEFQVEDAGGRLHVVAADVQDPGTAGAAHADRAGVP